MTYPQIGNYGIDETDVQSAFPGDTARPASAPAMRGMIVRDMCATPSNWRSAVSVPEYLRAHGIVAIEGVDTRAWCATCATTAPRWHYLDRGL